MEDVGRTESSEDLLETGRIRDASHHRHHVDLRVDLGDLELGEVQGALRLLEKDQLARMESGDLASQLRADRAGAAGDQHHLPRQLAAHRRKVQVDYAAPQNILDLDIPQLRHPRAAVQQFLQRRHDLELDPGIHAGAHDRLQLLTAPRRDRDHQQLDLLANHQTLQLGRRADDRYPVDAHVPLAGIVVHQPDRVDVRDQPAMHAV